MALPRKTVVTFGSGAIGEAVYLALFNGFITIYYNQVLGLSNTLIGTAIMLAMIGDAITDPVIGIFSDRFRSRHGRRHPFLFSAPIPIALSVFFIFSPPDLFVDNLSGDNQMPLFLWLCFWTVLSRAFITLYIVPHLALGGELSKDQHQRSRLFSANSSFQYVAAATFIFIAWSVFFSGEGIRASDGKSLPGHLLAESYTPLVLFSCCLIVTSIWACAAGTYKHVPDLTQPSSEEEKITLSDFFKLIGKTLKNRNYLTVLVGYFFFMIASGVWDTLNVFINTYFWELKPDQIRWLGLIMAPAGLAGALTAPSLMKKYDRKPVMLSAIVGMAIFAQLMVDLRLLGFAPTNDSPLLLPLLLANAAGFAFTIGLGTVSIYSMIGDIIDENELDTGKREEGLFYSARSFFAKASYSIGHLVAGIALDVFVVLPNNAVPGELDIETLHRLGLLAGPGIALASFISCLVYAKYKLNKQTHEDILLKLEQRAIA